MRYATFWGDKYYPRGGFKDCHALFPDKAEAVTFGKKLVEGDPSRWAHAVDLYDMCVVWEVS